jgi:hypothetical protein
MEKSCNTCKYQINYNFLTCQNYGTCINKNNWKGTTKEKYIIDDDTTVREIKEWLGEIDQLQLNQEHDIIIKIDKYGRGDISRVSDKDIFITTISRLPEFMSNNFLDFKIESILLDPIKKTKLVQKIKDSGMLEDII